MKVVYVTPRYGEEVVGGAEHAARMLAERLHSQLDFSVEVFTSTAIDTDTWAPHYDVGAVDVNGVRVHRFATTGRHTRFLETSDAVLANPKLATPAEQARWIEEQGPVVPELLKALASSDADIFAFYPYLYYPTVRGLPLVADRSVMHPAAHDEVPLRLPLFSRLFAQTQGLVFQTEGERRLTERLFPVAHHPQLLLGLGVDPQPGDEPGFRAATGVGDRPYVLCVGRVDDGKGALVLSTYFAEYKRRSPGPLALVFAGPVLQRPASHPDIFVAGSVTEAHKWGAFAGARALISPSAYEAFSIVLMEAWSSGLPVVVNGACSATREHVEHSGGGLWFDGYGRFEAILHLLLHNERLAQQLASAGKRYVDEHFRWERLIGRYGAFLQSLARNRKVTAA